MKNFLVAFLLAVAASFCSHAEYLYYQVVALGSNGIYTSDDGYTFYFNGHQIESINIMRTNGERSETLDPAFEGANGSFYFMTGDDYEGTGNFGWGLAVDIGEASKAGAYSYYIELVGYDDAAFGSGNSGVIGVSDTFVYAQLEPHRVTAGGMNMTPWTGGTYNVPEPSGALLLLVGAALMGLKRRKV